MLDKLFKFGWKLYSTIEETKKLITPEQLALLQKAYAAFHGLSSIKDINDHLNEPRFCSMPDTMPVGTNVCKWPTSKVTWSVLQSLAGVQMVECATEAFARWAAVSGLTPVYSPNDQGAMIVIGTRKIDGALGVLAESELPCGNVTQCRQWYDLSEAWSRFDGSSNGAQIDIVRVMCHELGHALGMNHIGTGNLLAPIYSQTVNKPQAGDIAEMQARYGPPTVPAPTIPVTPESYTLHFESGKLTVDGYRLTKLVS
jgi:Matrixin